MDRTNLFFLVIAGGVAWFAWQEYQKQREAQAAMFRQRRATEALKPAPIDYAEQIATGYI